MQTYRQQPYRRHKIRLDGYDANYILTSFDIDEQVSNRMAA